VIVAVVALALALAAAVGGLITFGLKLAGAERRCGDARSDESALAVRLEVAIANTHNESARADDEKRRADALDDLLASAAVSGPVDGSFDRLLQSWRDARARAAGGTGAGAVPAKTAPAKAGPNDLLRPGE
jgi:hypothetical protein